MIVDALSRWPTRIALLLMAVGSAALAHVSGGYYIGAWSLAAFGAVWLAGMATWSSAGWWRTHTVPARIAIVAIAAFAAWSYLAIAWSANQQAAWVEANRTLMYAAAVWLVAAIVRSARDLGLLIVAGTVAGLGASTALIVRLLQSDADTLFRNGRLIGTLGYHNGTAALLLVPVWAVLAVASAPAVPSALRALLVGALALSVQLAVLPQSRGAAIAFLIGGAVYFLLAPSRLRSLPNLALALAPAAFGWHALGAPYRAWSDGRSITEDLHHAVNQSLIAAAAATLAAALWWLVAQRVSLPRQVRRGVGAVFVLGACAAVVLGGVLLVDRIGNPYDAARDTWRNSSRPVHESTPKGSRLVAAGAASNTARIILWRVALRDVREHPLLGVGPANYEATFYQHRVQVLDKYVRQPHDLTLEVLAERGVVGGVLGALAVIAALWCAVGGAVRRRSRDPRFATLLGGAAASAVAWLAHAQLDWLWQLPAVTLPVCLLLGSAIGAATVTREADAVEDAALTRRRRGARVTRVLLVPCVVAAMVSIALPWLAHRYVVQAGEYAARGQQGQALAAARSAERLAPRDPEAAQAVALGLEATGDVRGARRHARRQRELAREHYGSWLFEARFEHRAGDQPAAQRLLGEARRRNPLDTDLDARDVLSGTDPA